MDDIDEVDWDVRIETPPRRQSEMVVMQFVAADDRREGELDIADAVSEYLWESCEGEDLKHLEAISKEAIDAWQAAVRELLKRYRANLFFDNAGNARRQTEE